MVEVQQQHLLIVSDPSSHFGVGYFRCRQLRSLTNCDAKKLFRDPKVSCLTGPQVEERVVTGDISDTYTG